MRRHEILLGTQGNDAGGIDVIVGDVIVALDMIEIHGHANAIVLV